MTNNNSKKLKFELNELCQQCYSMASHGLNQTRIAQMLDIHPNTLSKWKHNHPELAEAIRQGKMSAITHIEEKLFELAVGYNTEMTTHVETIHYNAKGHESGRTMRTTTRRVSFPPNIKAISRYLRANNPSKWHESAMEHNADLERKTAELAENHSDIVGDESIEAVLIMHDENGAEHIFRGEQNNEQMFSPVECETRPPFIMSYAEQPYPGLNSVCHPNTPTPDTTPDLFEYPADAHSKPDPRRRKNYVYPVYAPDCDDDDGVPKNEIDNYIGDYYCEKMEYLGYGKMVMRKSTEAVA